MIKFKRITFLNFLAFGNYETEVILDRSNITIFTGPNGVGKSTFLDALMFALYGRPYRNINKPQLVNSITNKGLLVTIEFEQDGKQYKIIRGIKPIIFEIYQDGVLLPQDSKSLDYQEQLEQNILRCGAKTFSQVVILGSGNYTPFLDLPMADRRKIIENILDLEIYTVMNTILKERIILNKTAVSGEEIEKRHSIETLRIIEENITKISFSKKTEVESYFQTIENLREQGLKVKDDYLKEKALSIADYTSPLKKYIDLKNLRLQEISQFSNTIRSVEQELSFYREHEVCNECKQTIDETFKSKIINDKQFELTNLNIDLENVNEILAEINGNIREAERKQKEYVESQNRLSGFRKEMDSLASQIKIWEGMIKKEVEKKDVDTSGLEEVKSNLEGYNTNLEKLYKDRDVYEILSRLLKDDGIKAIEIEKYIEMINEMINKYLLEMNFPCLFYLDSEFKETIKSRYRDTFSFNSFSEGQKKRINLAILFAWMEVAARKNSVSTNLLIFDEILDTSLDDAGKEDFFGLLRKLMEGKSIFIISHNEKFVSMAQERVEAKMIQGFSRYFNQ